MLQRCLFLMVSGFLLTGCIGISPPVAEVQAVRLDDSAAGGGRVLVEVKVSNPNDENLPMPRVSYEVDVVGAGQFAFTDIPYAALPRQGEQTLVLPAAVRGQNIQGKQYRVSGTVVFQPEGNLRRFFYDNGLPRPRASFTAEGVLE
ncbi:MAG: hypothetical protein AAGH88_16015 [Planctomycetota bacterium]